MRLDLFIRTLIWLAFISIWIYLCKPANSGLLEFKSGWERVLGLGLIILGTAMYVWSAVLLATAAPILLSEPVRLLIRGPYAYVRNPLYLAIGVILAGITTLYGAWNTSNVIAAIIVAIAVHFRVIRHEEPATRRKLGVPYEEYCKVVPRWFPRWSSPAQGDK